VQKEKLKTIGGAQSIVQEKEEGANEKSPKNHKQTFPCPKFA
jgi:hypothetical protein